MDKFGQETVFNPYALKCGHIFCNSCACSAASVLIFQGIKAAPRHSKCPICREVCLDSCNIKRVLLSTFVSNIYNEVNLDLFLAVSGWSLRGSSSHDRAASSFKDTVRQVSNFRLHQISIDVSIKFELMIIIIHIARWCFHSLSN